MSDQAIEQEIKAKGKTAPRIILAEIEANIASEHYFTAANGVEGAACRDAAEENRSTLSWQSPPSLDLVTFCVLVLKNGFTITGESVCASPEIFDEEIGQAIARENAVNKICLLMGYELKSKLA